MNEAAREEICASCHGSGTTTAMHGGLGPDDYEVEVSCPKCGGTGTLPATPKPRAGEHEGMLRDRLNYLAAWAESSDAPEDAATIREAIAERDSLAAQVGELVQLVQSHRDTFLLQALRDRAEPNMANGWISLSEQAKALLAKHGR